MNQNDKVFGPAEIIEIAANDMGVRDSEMKRVRSSWTQKIRRYLKEAGFKDESTGRYGTSRLGAQIIFKELRPYFYRSLNREDEIAEIEEAEEAAKQLLLQRRNSFEQNAPAEWLQTIKEMKQRSVDQLPSSEPEYSKETLEAFEKEDEYAMSLNAISDKDEVAFMIRAIFFNAVGKDFDLVQFRKDYAERRRHRALLQYPGDGPEVERLAERYIELETKVDTTLEGKDLSAYSLKKERN